jgi:hypothetical protein
MIIFCSVISLLLCGFFLFYHKTSFSPNKRPDSITNPASYFLSGVATVCLSLGCQDMSIGVPKKITVLKSLRCIFLVTCVFGMLNYYVYTSKLISLLTIEKYDLPVKKLEDFLSNDDYQLMIMNNDGMESYFSDADVIVRKRI